MAIHYSCRHCKTMIGTIDKQIPEVALGFQFLTRNERKRIISYDVNGDIEVSVICEYCREALLSNPELALLTSPLQ